MLYFIGILVLSKEKAKGCDEAQLVCSIQRHWKYNKITTSANDS